MLLVQDAVLPVFILATLGYVLFKAGFINIELSRGLNRLVYYIGLPSLLYHKISKQELDWSSAGNVLTAFFVALILTIVIAYIVGFSIKVSPHSRGAFVQAAYRGNLGFIGLPIVLYAVAPGTLERTSSLAAFALAPCAIAFNVIAVSLMIIHRPDSETKKSNFFWTLFTNPLIIGGLLGVAAAYFHWRLPLFIERSIEGMSNFSVPAALLGLGSSFGAFGIQSVNRQFVVAATATTLIKVFMSPFLGILFSLLFQLDFVEARIVVVYLATPTAIASHVIVGQFKGDEQLAASAIVAATLSSVIFIPLALWATQEKTWLWLVSLFSG